MKLISYSEFSSVVLAKFSLDGIEYFFEHYERLGYMKVTIAETDEDIGLTQDQCADILNELKKQNKYRKEVPVNHWKLRNAQDDDEYYHRGRG